MSARTILRNVGSNSLGYVVNVVVGLLVSPIIVRKLGDDMYGAWSVIVSFVGYYGLFDAGIRSAVGHFVATYHARNDHPGVNRTLGTAMGIMLGVALLTMGITVVGAERLPDWYERMRSLFAGTTLIDAKDALAAAKDPESLRIAIYVMGFGFALSFPMALYGTVIYASQRLGLQNAIGITQTALRALLTVFALQRGYGVVGLAVVVVGTNLLGWIATVIGAYRVLPYVSFALTNFAKRSVRELYSYGGFNMLVNMGDIVLLYTSSIVIGQCMPPSAITYYNMGAQLIPYFMSIVQAVTWSFTPYVTGRWATGDVEGVRKVLGVGTRGVLVLAALIAGGLMFVGREFLAIWQDPKYVSGVEFTSSATVVAILAVATLFRAAQSCGRQILFAMREVRYLGVLVFIEAAINVVLSVILVRHWGLLGVAVATLIPVLFTQGFVQPRHLLRELGMDPRRFLLDALRATLPVLATMALTALLLGPRLPAHDWPTFVVRALLLAVPATVVGFLCGTTADERHQVLRRFGVEKPPKATVAD